MGTIIKELVYFCPIDDPVTAEAIVEQIEMRMQVEALIQDRMSSTDNEW